MADRFIFTTWGRREVEIEAERVSFEPEHVVFWSRGRIVQAESNHNVLRLRQEPGGRSGY